jgi:hypothetical protein
VAVRVKLHSFLTSALDGYEQTVSRPAASLSCRERAHGKI